MKNKKNLNHSNLLLISPLYQLSSVHIKNEDYTTETNSNTDQTTQKNKKKFISPHLKLKPLDLNFIKNKKNSNSFLKNKSLLNKILNFKSNKILPNIKSYFSSRNNKKDYFDHTKYIDYFKKDNYNNDKMNNSNFYNKDKNNIIFNTIYKNDSYKKNDVMLYHNKNVSSINLEKNINKIINKNNNKSLTPIKKKSLSPLNNLNYSLIKSNDITKVYYNFKNIINSENEMIEREISNFQNSNLTTIGKEDQNNINNKNKLKSKTIEINRRGGYYNLTNKIDKLIGNKFKKNKKLIKKLENPKIKENSFHNNSNKIILKKLEEKNFYSNKNNKTLINKNNTQIKSNKDVVIKNKNLFNKNDNKNLIIKENENLNITKLKSIIKKDSKNLNKNQNKNIIYNLKTITNNDNNINSLKTIDNNLIPKISNNKVNFDKKTSKSLKNITFIKSDNYIDFNRKKTLLKNKSSFSSKKSIFEDDEGENLHEHEDSSFELFHKYRRKTKKKHLSAKKFNSKKSFIRQLTSNKGLNYIEIINLKKNEKNLLLSLSPKKTLAQNLKKFQNDYFIKELKNKIKKKLKISYKETIPKIHLSIEDCVKNSFKNNTKFNNILDEFYFLDKIESYKNFFECNKLFQNKVTIGESSFLTNKYLTINPQIIANFILPQIHQKQNISNIKISYSYNNLMEKNNINVRSGITRKVTKRITLNSKATNIKILFNNNIFEKSILQDKNNLIFYEKIIYLDYSPINFDLDSINRLKDISDENEKSIIIFSNNSSTEHLDLNNIKNLTKTKTKTIFKHKKTRKQKINLELLKNMKLFDVNRNINNISLFNLYKEQFGNDSFLFDLLKEVEIYSNNLDNNKFNNSQIRNNFYMLLFYLFNYCINNNENILFVKIFNRYKDIFDVNSKDKNNDDNTLLINATKVNSYKIVEFLLMKGSESNYRNRYGNTALHYAISYKYFKIVDLLKKYGAREDIENNFGQIPWECENGTCE